MGMHAQVAQQMKLPAKQMDIHQLSAIMEEQKEHSLLEVKDSIPPKPAQSKPPVKEYKISKVMYSSRRPEQKSRIDIHLEKSDPIKPMAIDHVPKIQSPQKPIPIAKNKTITTADKRLVQLIKASQPALPQPIQISKSF